MKDDIFRMKITMEIEDCIRGINLILFSRQYLSAKPYRFRQQRLQRTRTGRKFNDCQREIRRKLNVLNTSSTTQKSQQQKSLLFASLMDICHLKHAELAEQLYNLFRTQRQRRYRWLRSIHQTRCISFSYDSSKNTG